MRHAYLIMAHNEFGVLQKLIDALDDDRNDIFVHVDQKVKTCPRLNTESAGLFYTEERIDVRWGTMSQIKAEYALFEETIRRGGNYIRYHVLSGTHLPLKPQDAIHAYFAKEENRNSELLRFMYTNKYEVNMKLGRYHFCLNGYQHPNSFLRAVSSRVWHGLLKVQYMCRIQRMPPAVQIKANNWVSLTPKAVAYIVLNKARILKEFRWTFCGDEFFIPYLLETSKDPFFIKNDAQLLYDDIQENANARVLTNRDYALLMESGCLFARKFSEQHMDIVYDILKQVKS
ncbi:beta-1,6-N-acetylglucosaminyltransferase [Sphingobacterium suaedae]|uniref:Peptide O-xylosyltransferase n=1 Tax=Sphingobacterium suaedae TaxID=1686402 RepID=A0ABW5KMY8_9SPHI